MRTWRESSLADATLLHSSRGASLRWSRYDLVGFHESASVTVGGWRDHHLEADLPEGASCAAILTMAARAVSNLEVLGRAASRKHGRPGSIASVIANYPFILGCFGEVSPRFLVGPGRSAGGYLPFHPRRRRRRSLSEDMIRPFCNPSRMPRLKRHSFGRKPLVALHLPQGCISDVPEIDTFVSEVESKRFFNKESSKVLSGVFMDESPRSSRSTVGMS